MYHIPKDNASFTGCSEHKGDMTIPLSTWRSRLGNALGQPVLTVFSLTADYPEAQRRHYRFLVEGLVDVEQDLAVRNVPLLVRLGRPGDVVPALAAEVVLRWWSVMKTRCGLETSGEPR